MPAERPQKPRSLEQLFATLGEAEDSEQAFLQLIFETAARSDPELPELLRAGAIPRTLNAAVVGVLRGAPDDIDRNRRLLELISGYRFVLRRPDGGWTYHDNTRDYLVADWRSTDAKRSRFVEFNHALADFYEARYAEDRESDRYLTEVAALIARANPGRQRRVTAAVEAGMGANLLEAAYHHLLADPRGGFDFFQDMFFELEGANRLGICQSMIASTRDFLQRLPGESEPTLLAWLDYFDARVQRALPGYEAARLEDMLRGLLARQDVPPDLQGWALNDLAQLYEDQLKIDEAMRARLDWVEQSAEVDRYNAPLRHSGLGNLYQWLGDFQQAVGQFQQAIELVNELPIARADVGVTGRLALGEVYGELGQWDLAFDAAIEALYRARTSFTRDRITQRSVAVRLAQLLSTFDVRASDCASEEAVALTETKASELLDVIVNRIDVLLDTGRVRTARVWIDRLRTELGQTDGEYPLRFRLAYECARLAELEDRQLEAHDAFSTLLEDIVDQPESDLLRINALINRGSIRTTLGDAAGAIADLTAACHEWERCGCHIDAAAASVRLSRAYLKVGDIATAQRLLGAAEAELPPGISLYRLVLLRTKGEVDEQLGHWSAAKDHYQQGLEVAVARRDPRRQASLLRKLAAVQAKASAQQVSAEYIRRAVEAEHQLADKATARQRRAQSENGKGIRSFCDLDDRTTALDRARLFFGSAAKLDPGNVWPLLNLSFVYAEQQDWQGASETLEQVLDLSPAPMRTARLHRCLHDYVMGYAQEMISRQDVDKAVTVLAAALDRLSGKLPAAELTPMRAVYALALAVAGKGQTARDVCREALALAGGEHLFIESVTPLVDAVDDYWAVDTMLQEVQDEPDASTAVPEKAVLVRAELRFRLDQILGLTRDPSAPEWPVVRPIIVEVGDELVPIVDSRQDGGAFLYELIPAMRKRILMGTGVNVPGVLMRGDQALPGRGYRVRVDEVPALIGSVPSSASIIESHAAAQDRALIGELTDFQPLTGERGLWVIGGATEHRTHEANLLTPAQFLIYRIELVIRTHLVRYLGPEEVSTLTNTWSEQDNEGLVSAVLPDADARLLLTWTLQELVDDEVPITDWRSILTVVRDAGGITAPPRALGHLLRARLRYQLPGPQHGRTTLTVPPQYETALLGRAPDGPAAPRHEFLRWLRQTVDVTGPAITLVTETQEAREVVSTLARTENRMITTLSRDELIAP